MDPLFKKLNYKDQQQIHVLNCPDSFHPVLQSLGKEIRVSHSLEKGDKVAFVIAFVTLKAEVEACMKLIGAGISKGTLIWFCYPKGTSKKYKCDFNRDTGWSAMDAYGLEGVRLVAIDEDWSAMRFRFSTEVKRG